MSGNAVMKPIVSYAKKSHNKEKIIRIKGHAFCCCWVFYQSSWQDVTEVFFPAVLWVVKSGILKSPDITINLSVSLFGSSSSCPTCLVVPLFGVCLQQLWCLSGLSYLCTLLSVILLQLLNSKCSSSPLVSSVTISSRGQRYLHCHQVQAKFRQSPGALCRLH